MNDQDQAPLQPVEDQPPAPQGADARNWQAHEPDAERPSLAQPLGLPGIEAGKGPGAQPQVQVPEQRQTLKLPKPWVTYVLIALCVGLFALQSYSMAVNRGIDIPFVFGGKINAAILQGQFWRFITPAFLHGSIYHILFNMYALYILGNRMESVYGHGRFLLLFLVSAFGGNTLSFVLSKSSSLGSSTAIFGLFAAEFVFLMTNKKFYRGAFQGEIIRMISLLAINLFIGIAPGSNIDNFGHLGGLLAGAFYALLTGPVWGPRREGAYLVVGDVRKKQEIWLGTLVVLAAFSAIAAIPFLN